MFANRVLRRNCGTERDVISDEWENLQNEEVNDMCS
jgi:hypothetical protein